MDIQSRITELVEVFDISTPLEELQRFFRESAYSHVGVVQDNKFLGVLAEEDLSNFEPGSVLEEHRASLEIFFAIKEASWLDVLKIFTSNQANLVPVLDETGVVLGYYDLIDILDFLVETPFFNEPGGLLVVAKGVKDHTFSEIAQIVESNNARLLGAFISGHENDVIQTTIKISSGNLNEVIQTFRRYNYGILFGNIDDQFLENLKQRSAYLDKYLNV